VPGALTIIENAMRWHKLDVDLQSMGCRFMELLLPKEAIENEETEFTHLASGRLVMSERTFIPGLRLLQTVVAAMKTAPDNNELQQNACYALGLLCSVSTLKLCIPESHVKIRREAMALFAGVDTIKKLKKIMIDNPTDVAVVTSACRAMSFLLVDATYDATLSQLDGVLIDAIRAHANDENVLAFGSRALASFALVHTDINQFRSPLECAQFATNIVQMSMHMDTKLDGIAIMEAVLSKKNQNKSRGSLTSHQLAHFETWQQYFVSAGAIRLLVQTMHALSVMSRRTLLPQHTRVARFVQYNLAMVLHTLYVLIDENVDAKMNFLDANGPNELMCVLSDFHFLTIGMSIPDQTWGPKNLTREGLVFLIFSMLSDTKNCGERQACRLRAVCSAMHAGSHHAYLPFYADVGADGSHDIMVLASPVQFAIICMANTKCVTTIVTCLWYLCRVCTSLLVCKQIDQRAMKCIAVVICFHMKPPGLSENDQLHIQKACIALLRQISKHVQFDTAGPLIDLVFMPVLPALREHLSYIMCLATLQRTLAYQQARHASIISCDAIKRTLTVSAADKLTAEEYLKFQQDHAYSPRTTEVRVPFLVAPTADDSYTGLCMMSVLCADLGVNLADIRVCPKNDSTAWPRPRGAWGEPLCGCGCRHCVSVCLYLAQRIGPNNAVCITHRQDSL
jgi:hypothetical protein